MIRKEVGIVAEIENTVFVSVTGSTFVIYGQEAARD